MLRKRTKLSLTASTSTNFPAKGSLTSSGRPFGVYVHIPFCHVRCGYCDFNTYTGLADVQQTYADDVIAEIQRSALAWKNPPNISTVFFGGGTPTLLASGELIRILDALDETYGLVVGAEVTTEANPDSVNEQSLRELRAGGFNRISFGMQSAMPHVLKTLDRTHDPERVAQAVYWARSAGFDNISLDLIYGTPGESLSDWETSLQQAIDLGPNHISAYALIVEPNTALARKISRGEIEPPDDDLSADKYELAEKMLSDAGFSWYELSNWRLDESAGCAHNELYWRSDDWWGFGPGAHSHVSGLRWWNSKNPRGYKTAGHEVLDEPTKQLEKVMLGIRMAVGMPTLDFDPNLVAELLDADLITVGDRIQLTLPGRLLADAVVRKLTG